MTGCRVVNPTTLGVVRGVVKGVVVFLPEVVGGFSVSIPASVVTVSSVLPISVGISVSMMVVEGISVCMTVVIDGLTNAGLQSFSY